MAGVSVPSPLLRSATGRHKEKLQLVATWLLGGLGSGSGGAEAPTTCFPPNLCWLRLGVGEARACMVGVSAPSPCCCLALLIAGQLPAMAISVPVSGSGQQQEKGEE